MAKVIKIENGVVTIGTDEGGLKTVREVDCNFEPQVGDEVEVFENENTIMAIKKEVKEQNTPNTPNGININLNNNLNANPQAYAGANGNLKAVNKTAYCLLAFLGGGLGIHKFYAGKVGMGVLYLLFFWTYIPLIISIIEFLVALFKKADANGNILV